MIDTTQLERDSSIRTTALVILTFIAVAVALYFLRPVLLPFVLALFIASGLVPVLNAVQGFLESSRPVAIFVTALLSITVTVALWLVIWISVSELLSNSGEYRDGVDQMLERIADTLDQYYPAEQPSSVAPNGSSDEVAERDRFEPLQRFFTERMESIIRLVGNELVILFSSGLLVMIFLFFLLLGGSNFQLPESNIWSDVDAHIRKYILAKSLISAVTGTAFGMVLWLFGVPLAFVLGMLAFLLNFIPNLGPIIASMLPVPLVWVMVETTWAKDLTWGQAGYFGLTQAVVVIVLASGVQFISGNVVEPKIMGDQFRLHPIAILLSLMFWYMIWGLVGAFLAVPITSALKIVLAQLDSTRLAADLLEGNLTILAKREPPTTAESA